MNLHVVKWSLVTVGVFAGMVGAGYLCACIVFEKIVNGPR